MKKINLIRSILFILLIIHHVGCAQSNDSTHHHKKLKWLIGSSSIAYAGSLVALNELWYEDFPRESFHFFDDSRQWKQLDKMGHYFSSYHISRTGHQALRWAGVNEKKSYLYGGLIGVIFMTPIEIMDGYSSAYGASASDIVANISGSALFAVQGLLWKEIRIHPKYSFNRSGLAPIRPNILGRSISEEVLKDYNAHTHWLSFDISSFQPKFPKWLNIAVGYGAHNMIYATDGSNTANGFSSYRQYYLALDWDLSHIKSRSPFIKALLYLGDMIHLPAPTLEYNRENKFKFHWLTY